MARVLIVGVGVAVVNPEAAIHHNDIVDCDTLHTVAIRSRICNVHNACQVSTVPRRTIEHSGDHRVVAGSCIGNSRALIDGHSDARCMVESVDARNSGITSIAWSVKPSRLGKSFTTHLNTRGAVSVSASRGNLQIAIHITMPGTKIMRRRNEGNARRIA